MKTVLNRRGLLLGLALLLAAGFRASADDDGGGWGRDEDDHDLARRALSEGQIKPFEEIAAVVDDQIDGEVVGVEFEVHDGRHIYEFKVITPSGRLREVWVDATTAEIFGDKGD